MILTGNSHKGRGASDSPLFSSNRLWVLTVAVMFTLMASAQGIISSKVYRHSENGRYYGKVYIPKGGKYYVDFHPKSNVSTGVFAAKIDGENIYLSSVRLLEERYMIDATNTAMAFVVRSTSSEDVVFNPVPADLSDWMDTNGYYYYDAIDARQNDLLFATEAISNATLNTKYPKKRIYAMANPSNHDLAFAVLNHQGTGRDLPKNSLYIISRKNFSNARLNIIWLDEPDSADEMESTSINNVEKTAEDNDAAPIYTLQGVRVNQVKKGTLYIRNGKKYIAR